MDNTFLLIDTATTATSVALTHGGRVIFAEVEPMPEGGASARAGVLVERAISVLRSEGLSIDAIGISAGPGSYTGLRIGSSLAKGLCHGFAVPLIAVSTLEMMATGYKEKLSDSGHELSANLRLTPMIDARRMEVYTATFDLELNRTEDDRAVILDPTSPFASDMQKYDYHFFGNGSAKCSGLWVGQQYHVDAGFIPEARYMLPLVSKAFSEKKFVDTAYWTPNYLKEYVATVAKNKVLG